MVFSRFALTSSLYPDWSGEGGDVVLQSTCTGGGKGGDGVLKVCSDSVPLIPGLEGGTGVPNVGSDPFPLPGYKGKGGGDDDALQSPCPGGGREAMASSRSALISSH